VKIKLSELRRVIANDFRSGGNVSPSSVMRKLRETTSNPDHVENGTSLDAQVDRYFTEYENGAKAAKTEGNDFFRTFRKLMEAEGDEEEMGDDEPTEEAPAEPTQPTKMTVEDIDVGAFVNDVARLIENYDNLLEVRSTIIKRSINFISKSYDSDVVKALKDAFKNEHSMVADKTESEHETDDFVAPRAAEAGPL